MKTNLEKLQAIKTRCQGLLAIAEKRTPGKWESCQRGDYYPVGGNHGVGGIEMVCIIGDDGTIKVAESYGDDDAPFIASCAGPFEAALDSTIAAIDDILQYPELHNQTEMERDILTAWEGSYDL